jgi:hypothetical protein
MHPKEYKFQRRGASIAAVHIKEAPLPGGVRGGFKFCSETGGGLAHVRPHSNYDRSVGRSKRAEHRSRPSALCVRLDAN